jgi:hypothetical protein
LSSTISRERQVNAEVTETPTNVITRRERTRKRPAYSLTANAPVVESIVIDAVLPTEIDLVEICPPVEGILGITPWTAETVLEAATIRAPAARAEHDGDKLLDASIILTLDRWFGYAAIVAC